jgi:hypothetical protein
MTSPRPCTAEPELWFSTLKADVAKAVKICRACPLQAECAQYAKDHDIRWGTWGESTERQRRCSPRKRQKKSEIPAACGTATAYWRHVNNGQSCDTCDAWHTADVEADRRRQLADEHAGGGSRRGYEIHRRLQEQPCDLCRAAHAQMLVERRRRKRATTPAL